MPFAALTAVPSTITKGTSVLFEIDDYTVEFPAATYTGTLQFSPHDTTQAAVAIAATGASAAGGWQFDLTAAAFTNLVAGQYTWVLEASAAGERFVVDRGRCTVYADPTTAGTDLRSHARIVLEAIQAVIENRATKDQASYTIAGRSLSRTPLPELLMLLDRYKREVYSEEQAERVAKGLPTRGRVLVRFP